jgi:hypothetical protein
MTRQHLTNVAASVRDRLSSIRRSTGANYQRLMVRYALERLLYRLSQSSYRDGFLLKGAILFTVWLGHPHRMTKDIDLLGFGEPSQSRIHGIFAQLSDLAVPDDGMRYDVNSLRSSEIKIADQYPGVRITLNGFIGSARLPLQIDIGFGDHCQQAETVSVPSILEMPTGNLGAIQRKQRCPRKSAP